MKFYCKCFYFYNFHLGPEGGFKVKLTDNPDGDLSEDESDELSDQSEDARSQISEVPENQSAMIATGTVGLIPVLKEKIKKRQDKAWHAAKELVDSEKRYVDKLHLLSEVNLNLKLPCSHHIVNIFIYHLF